MKTAEKWNSQIWQDGSKEAHNYQIIKQIQLDAMKEGMRRAAKTITPDVYKNRIKRQEEGVQAILTAAEQLTEKDL
jgi:hypothetical protein